MSESKNDPKKNGPAELSARYDQKYTIQRHTIINTLSAIVLSRQPIFFSVALRVFLGSTLSTQVKFVTLRL